MRIGHVGIVWAKKFETGWTVFSTIDGLRGVVKEGCKRHEAEELITKIKTRYDERKTQGDVLQD